MKTRVERNPPGKFPCIAIDSRNGDLVGLTKSRTENHATILRTGEGRGDLLFTRYKIEGLWPYEFFPSKLVLSNEQEVKPVLEKNSYVSRVGSMEV